MTKAFYERTGDGFTPTDYVTGPWADDLSHAGPPAALLLNEIAARAEGMGITRATFEIPVPIPKVPYRIVIEDLRGGRKIRLVHADLITPDDTKVMSVNAWCMRTTDAGLPTSDPYSLDFPDPDDCAPMRMHLRDGIDYFDGVDARTAEGTPFGGGPSTIWVRQTVPLISGELSHPYARCGLFGDLANGTAPIVPFGEILAINTDLTLYLSRAPESEWMALKSLTISHGLGLGMTDSLVYDASGFVGRANQSVFFDHF